MLKKLYVIAFILVLIGSINWGLIGLFKFNLVAAIFGGIENILSRIVYTIVGLSGIFIIYNALRKND